MPTPIDPEAFKVVAALDLSLMVPALATGGVVLCQVWEPDPREDALDIDRIDVIGISAGATSALQLAPRHPERVKHLAVLVGNLPGNVARRPVV